MDVWHHLEERGASEALVLPAPPDEQDGLLLKRIAPLVGAGDHSFLRAIKPDWRLIVVRHAPPRDFAADDAVADSAAVLALIRLEREGRVARTRRELAFASIVRVLEVSGVPREERLGLHRQAYVWPIEIGRWDENAVRGLERRFRELEPGLVALAASARAGAEDAWGGPEATAVALARWSRVASFPAGGDSIGAARRLLARHENRLGVFAEPDAILHYFLYRLAGGPPHLDVS